MVTSNKSMSDMMRKRRDEMTDMMAYEPPTGPNDAGDMAAETSEPSEPTSKITVAAPGEPSTGDQFEYEPMTDIPGAWVIYPPGVPCDDTEYRIQMSSPATADDFPAMQKAIDDASGGTSVTPETSVVSELDSEEGGY